MDMFEYMHKGILEKKTFLVSRMGPPRTTSPAMPVFSALKSVKKKLTGRILSYLKDAHYSGVRKLGRGLTYKYPHDYKNHYVDQQHLPDELVDRKFYEMSDNGYEKGMKACLKRIGEY